MLRDCLLAALLVVVVSLPAPSRSQESGDDPYRYTRRLNMLSAAAEDGRYANSFAEDQGQKPPRDFTVFSGQWIVGTGGEDGRHGDHHVAQILSSATFCLLERSYLVTRNFHAEVAVSGDGGENARAAGLYFHRLDGPAFTFVELDFRNNRVAAGLWDGTAEQPLATAACPLWKENWHRLGVEVEASRLTVRVRGQTVLSATLPYDDVAGFMGLLTRRDTRARFDELVIRPDSNDDYRRQRPKSTEP